MCSIPPQRIAAFGRAIEDLAARARSGGTGAAYPAAGGPAELSASDGAESPARQAAELGAREAADPAMRQASPSDLHDRQGFVWPEAHKPLTIMKTAELGGGEDAEPAAPGTAGPGDGRAASVVSPGGNGPAAPADVLNRLAELWAELAILDPEVARRLPTYEA